MSRLVQPMRAKTMQFPLSAKIWYSGMAVSKVPGAGYVAEEDRGLQDVGTDVAVRKHGALGDTGGAAGILQKSEVIPVNADRLYGELRPGCYRGLEGHGARD